MSKIHRALIFSLFVSFLSILLAKPLLADALGGLRSSLDPLVVIHPPELVRNVGDTFTVEVVIEGASNLGGYQFEMDFDPSIVQVVGVEDGGFLGSTGRAVIPTGPDIDNAVGTLTFGAVSIGAQPGPDGEGTLAIITLEAVGVGVSSLHLHDVMVLNTAAGEETPNVEDGQVKVVGPTPTYTPTEVATATPTGTPTATSTPAAPGATPTEAVPTGAATPTEMGKPTPTGAATATSTPAALGATPTETMLTATPAEMGKPTPTSTPAPPTLTLTATPSTPKPTAPTPTPSSYPSETKGGAGGNPPLFIAIGLAGIAAIALAALWGKKLWGGQ